MDTRFDGSDLGRGDGRDLFIGEALYVPEQEHGSLLGGEGFERLFDDAERLAIGGEVRELRSGRRRLGPACGVVIFGRGIERQLGSPLSGA